VETKLNPTAPGEYTGTIDIKENGVYMVNGKQEKNGEIINAVKAGYAVQYSPEYRLNSSSNLDKLVTQVGGKIISEPCPTCRGTGKERKNRKIKINVPAGVDTGNVIPLRGHGEHGANGGPPGDLYVNIRVASHSLFKRKGFDISIDRHISFAKATFGCEIKVPTVDGDVKYEIPAGTQPGTVFRLKGKGVPRVNSSGRGDQYVTVIVDVPKTLNDKQKEALRMFMEASGENKEEGKKSFVNKIKDSFK
jgi:molecular chaperone DnaJ